MSAPRDRFRAKVAQARDLVEAKRETSTVVSVAYDAFGHDIEAGGPVLAAALGFRVFLFVVPYVCFVMLLIGYLSDLLGRPADDLIRGGGIAAVTATGIATGQDWSTAARLGASLLVAYTLVIAARSFVKVLVIVHALVWRAAPTRLRHPTRATLVFIGAVTVAVALAGLIDDLRHRFLIGGIAALVLYTLVAFAVWWVVSWWLPHGNSDLLGLMPGAAVFAIGVQILHVATVVWLPHTLKSKSEIYGTIGCALALLFWAYLLGRLMAVAGALNVALWRRRTGEPPSLPGFLVRLPLVGGWLGWVWIRLVRTTDEPAQVEPSEGG